MEWIYPIITIIGWGATCFLSTQQNNRHLKQQTKIETIKYIHQIKEALQKNILTSHTSKLNQVIDMDIRQIRILLKDVISRKKIDQFKTPLTEIRTNISQLDTPNISKQEIKKIKKESLLSLNILNNITLMYPFKN